MSPGHPYRWPPSDLPRPLTQGQVKEVYCPVSTIAGEGKYYLDGLAHRMPLEVIRGLETVEVPQMTAEPKLKKLRAEHRDPFSLSPAVRQRPHGLAQYGRDDRPALAKHQGNDAQIYPASRRGKKENTCKGDLEGVDAEFLPPPLARHWKVAPGEVLRQ